MAITRVAHHGSGPIQPVSFEPPAAVNGDGEIASAGFQALHDTDAEATIDWGDGWQAAQASAGVAGGGVIAYVLIHPIGETGEPDVRRYDIESGDEIRVYAKQIIEFPFTIGDQMRFIVDGDHLVVQFPGELGFLTLLDFQKYLLDPETAAHLEWGLGGNTIASVEDVRAQLAPAGAEALSPSPLEAGVPTAGSGRDAAHTFGDPLFATLFALTQFEPG